MRELRTAPVRSGVVQEHGRPSAPDMPAEALHALLERRYVRDGVLVGPDSGVRLNHRVGRFVKSYLRALPWKDDLCYMQAQAYWILANWELWDRTRDPRHRALALAAGAGVLSRQRGDGAWEYPNPAWQGRIATAEGSWASIALAESHRRSGDPAFLEAALRWWRFLLDEIGFSAAPGGSAVNYFAGRATAAVPNNSAFTMRMLAELADASGDGTLLERCAPMLGFVAAAQLPTGELPYEVGAHARRHFQCTQYNAFQALDLSRYEQLTGDRAAAPVVAGLMGFLRDRVGPGGAIPYACGAARPQVSYHLAAVSAALAEGHRRGIDGCAAAAERALARLLALQDPDGAFPHSLGDHRILRDRRAYPRNLAMILHHLLSLTPAPANHA
jgi:hypothetical protein